MSVPDKNIAGSIVLMLMKSQEKTLKKMLIASVVTAVFTTVMGAATIYVGYKYVQLQYMVAQMGKD